MDNTYNIRTANENDLFSIREWVSEFRCNLNIIEQSVRDEQLIVLEKNNFIVGFLVLTPCELLILEINSKYRGQGYGKALVEWAMAQYFEQDINVVNVECTPETSVSFWKHMGFEIFEKPNNWDGKQYGYKVLERDLKANLGESKHVLIEFYPESILHSNQEIPPFKTYDMENCMASEGVIDLSRRAICSYIELEGDPVISINVDNQNIYKNKIKRECAEKIGVKRDKSFTYYIDQIIQ
tara:strand:+ start:678 stop:1394 length:717 start_codon:yes stop_codon:yes gene_type:complete